MRSPPADLVPDHLTTALADGWRLSPGSMTYLPEGGGSHHWVLADGDGRRHFVTVDDLDGKDWLGDTRQPVFEGLRRALQTAAVLRHQAGLEFVVAPVPALDGSPLRRLGGRYTVSLFPFLPGRSFPFGPYPDAALRGQVLDMLAALHRSAPAVRDLAPAHAPGFTDRAGLDAFLRDPGRPWDGGPFSAAAHDLVAARSAEIARLTAGFDRLAEATAAARAEPVITHGEPHPGNIMHVGGRLMLVDWDTVALAPPERDVSLVVAGPRDIGRYQDAAGREVSSGVITLYRLRWYLDDLSSAIQMFRDPHDDTPDTRRWWQAHAPQLEELPRWLDLID